MSDDQRQSFADFWRLPDSASTMQPNLAQQVQSVIDTQTRFLDDCEDMFSGWLKRRRAATQSMRETLEKMSQCRDLAEIATLQQAWLAGSFERLNEDAKACGTLLAHYGAGPFAASEAAVGEGTASKRGTAAKRPAKAVAEGEKAA